jgi:hypothetical protein
MPTTTKMGIVYPSSTDLVKDGATAMGTISTTVDSKTGLVLLNTTTLTGSATSAAANTFSANFQNYKIVLNYVLSGGSTMKLRLVAAGTPVSTTTYRRTGWYYFSTSASGYFDASNSGTSFNLADAATAFSSIDLFRPFEAATTGFIAQTTHDTGTNNIGLVLAGLNTNATSYDTIQLSPDSGTFSSGTMRIYGYN